MIIFEEEADIFESNCQTLVVPVNTVGVMGAGLALAFKLRYPGLEEAYKKACHFGLFKRDGFFVFDVNKDRKLLCIPTKRHWKAPSNLVWIHEALARLSQDYAKWGITNIAIPAIGCGLGELEWENVRPLIYEYLDPLPGNVGIYLPPKHLGKKHDRSKSRSGRKD